MGLKPNARAQVFAPPQLYNKVVELQNKYNKVRDIKYFYFYFS